MEILALRLLHVLGGIFWVGCILFTSFFLFPVLARSPEAAGPVMAGLRVRGLLLALPLAALLTIGSGLRLLQIASAGFSASYFGTGPGQVYLASGIMAVVAFLVGLLVTRPAAARAAGLAAAGPAAQAELAAVRSRAARSATVVAVLVILASAGMAIGRYT